MWSTNVYSIPTNGLALWILLIFCLTLAFSFTEIQYRIIGHFFKSCRCYTYISIDVSYSGDAVQYPWQWWILEWWGDACSWKCRAWPRHKRQDHQKRCSEVSFLYWWAVTWCLIHPLKKKKNLAVWLTIESKTMMLVSVSLYPQFWQSMCYHFCCYFLLS